MAQQRKCSCDADMNISALLWTRVPAWHKLNKHSPYSLTATEFIFCFFFIVRYATMLWFQLESFLRFCHCTICFGIIGHQHVHWNSGRKICAFRATAISVFLFIMFPCYVNIVHYLWFNEKTNFVSILSSWDTFKLYEYTVNAVGCVLTFWHACCLSSVQCGCYECCGTGSALYKGTGDGGAAI
jgi:hypothetical protein